MRTPVMIADAALELVDARFKEISLSKEIIVNVYTYDEYKDLDHDLLKNPSDDLLQNAPLPRITKITVVDIEEEGSENDSDMYSDEFPRIKMEGDSNDDLDYGY
jgi:hypothetical protein